MKLSCVLWKYKLNTLVTNVVAEKVIHLMLKSYELYIIVYLSMISIPHLYIEKNFILSFYILHYFIFSFFKRILHSSLGKEFFEEIIYLLEGK